MSRAENTKPETVGIVTTNAKHIGMGNDSARMVAMIRSHIRRNLGCGPVQPRGWINIDGSLRAGLATRACWLDRALVRLGVLPPTEFGPQTTFIISFSLCRFSRTAFSAFTPASCGSTSSCPMPFD